MAGGIMKRIVVFLALVAVAALPAFAQDASKKVNITGAWEITVESPQGTMTMTANYKQDGETLTGNHTSEMGDMPLKGTVKGNDLEYTISLDMGGQAMSILHKGRIDGDTIKGTAELGGMGTMNWTAKRKK
jgi:hypothetical protein